MRRDHLGRVLERETPVRGPGAPVATVAARVSAAAGS